MNRWIQRSLTAVLLFLPLFASSSLYHKIRDGRTGAMLEGMLHLTRHHDGESAIARAAVSGKAELILEPGIYTIRAEAEGYLPLETTITVNDETPVETVAFHLDPVPMPEGLRRKTTDLPEDQAQLEGYLYDKDTGLPLVGHRVLMENQGYEGVTDEDGRFEIVYAWEQPIDAGNKPYVTVDNLIIESEDRRTTLQNISLLPGVTILREDLDMESGGISEDRRHRLDRGVPTQTELSPQTQVKPQFKRAPAVSRFIKPPASIRIGMDCSCSTCSRVVVRSLETYVANGLKSEWIASWGMDSLRSGAIAFRSYGAWHVDNPKATHYDICSTTCCQVYTDTTNSRTAQAARDTAGLMLVQAGESTAFRSEYSAQNNAWDDPNDGLTCNNGDLSCGNGSVGSPSTGWPCLADSVGRNRGCFGHGRGMSQWGTHYWSQQGRNWAWITNHYYNANGNGSGKRNSAISHPFALGALQVSSGQARPGTAITLGLNVTNHAGATHRILFGASLRDASGAYTSDAANDNLITLAPGAGLLQRPFNIPAGLASGSYRVVVGLYLDADGNGQLNSGDFRFHLTESSQALVIGDGGPPQAQLSLLIDDAANPIVFSVDADETVTRVRYYQGETLLGESEERADAFRIERTFSAGAAATITARGYNSAGLEVAADTGDFTAPGEDEAPTIAFANPGVIVNPAVFYVQTGATTARVVYLADGSFSLGESSNAENRFAVTYRFSGVGPRNLSAVAYDADGNEIAREDRSITIRNQAVVLSAPSPMTNPLHLSADAASNVTRIQYLADNRWDLGTSTDRNAAFSVYPQFGTTGERSITVVGFDAAGNEVGRDTRTITIRNEPLFFITPSNTTNPAKLQVRASGDTARIDYFADGTWPLGSSRARWNDFSVTYPFNQEGRRNISAVAYDRAGHELRRIEVPITIGSGGGTGEPDPQQGTSLQTSIRNIFNAASSHSLSGRVESLSGGFTYFTWNAGVGKIPASNQKMWVTGAAYHFLGEDHRFETDIHFNGTFSGGTLNGDLIIYSREDYTMALAYGGRDPVFNRIVDQLKSQGLQRVTGRVLAMGNWYETNYYSRSYSARLSSAASHFRNVLRNRGVTVNGSSGTLGGINAPDNRVYTHRSRTIAEAFKDLNKPSNNTYADILRAHLGHVVKGRISSAAGGEAMMDFLAEIDADYPENRVADGSGLSYSNRLSARTLIKMIRTLKTNPATASWEQTLAVGGVDGTLRNRLTENDVRGRVFAKTGTLNPVVSLSGVVTNRHNGNSYLFSFLMNDVVSKTNARATVDRAVRLIASNFEGPRNKGDFMHEEPPVVFLEETQRALAPDEWEQIVPAFTVLEP
ncbi:D-alanyl-D-alanine carboxypeptidase/D-alanyl-D-alanine endopeptidase [Acanthopleuribacter pedis]|uniref:D-alanyl-D-alanine carboxypeptidase/D-alanyl-D-alanine-endopeptidase n=1 Tax=Acanthopleuribacter pedis TaxID=442870 RepID=A0A8J7U3Y2_9BACT|nr:D-alanyl-D-alanine carboxypeptidase/D-alanyl-D-alanine-endopeptidase [Acanthopleuribacter pedis]MBO1319244.1 D-alanyl-D-alanine carboxypeptidase/D-alanyl-D-alanine-endopeptidase [Acanthopleuribacter pedis]